MAHTWALIPPFVITPPGHTPWLCRHVPNYDSLDCAAQWAKDSLNLHRSDKREHIYTRCGRPVAECVCADGSGLGVVGDGMCTP